MNYDFIIAGAGIIGLTVAREILVTRPGVKLVILEKEQSLGLHASGRNSGVLHTGIYYPANTLKAKFCKKGADSLFDYATEHKIPVRKDGKVIVARSEVNAAGLSQLMINAQENGINASLVNKSEINEIEPHAFADYGGIYCRDTAVINNKEVLKQLQKDIEKLGGEIRFDQSLLCIDDEKKFIRTKSLKIEYSYFINSTGAFADKIAKMAGVGDEFRLIPFKGLYYKLTDKYASRINGSIYPVPDPSLPFLGIHFTRSIDNEVYVGPTSIPALGRENYGTFSGLHFGESLSIFSDLASLYASNLQNFRNLVHKELPHYTKSGFLKSAGKLVDELQPHWLEVTPKVGIRPQLINTKENKLEMDFLMREGQNSLHILNSISPAFTSSFAVAEHIVDNLSI
jgi:L-2-hydroxyglutarate oxidase LhgO